MNIDCDYGFHGIFLILYCTWFDTYPQGDLVKPKLL